MPLPLLFSRSTRWLVVGGWLLGLGVVGPGWAGLADLPEFRALPGTETRVPRVLLPLARSIEGQREMGVEETHHGWIDALLRELDGEWSTNRPTAEVAQHAGMARLEARLAEAIGARLGTPALQRLR
ncbi:MAG: hypothetical protein ACKO3N_00195, partial [Verrucomicrobiota bacterium]